MVHNKRFFDLMHEQESGNVMPKCALATKSTQNAQSIEIGTPKLSITVRITHHDFTKAESTQHDQLIRDKKARASTSSQEK